MSWRSIIEDMRRNPSRSWIIMPEDPVSSDKHRSISAGCGAMMATATGRLLRSRGAQPGDIVGVASNNDPYVAAAVLGILSHGYTVSMVEDLAPEKLPGDTSWLIGRREALERLQSWRDQAVSIEDIEHAGQSAGASELPDVSDSAIAIHQRTSGSTGAPRWAKLSHANVLSSIRAIGEVVGVSKCDVGVSWLPLFHDMGLIGSLLFTTAWGIPLVFMSPRSFIMRPHSWLWAIHRFGATCTAAPNSAYHLCATKLDARRLHGLDLSTLRLAFNGSEPIYTATVDAFVSKFASHGLHRSAMRPAYGLAENTNAATISTHAEVSVDWVNADALEKSGVADPEQEAASGSRGIVCLGAALPNQEVTIRVGARLARDREVGEVHLRGAGVMQGYAASEDHPVDAEGWLATGDLGYLADGQLHVVGRAKQTIKYIGRTIDPAVVEMVALSIDSIRRAVAFGVMDAGTGTERVVIVVEVEKRRAVDGDDVQRGVRAAVTSAMKLAVSEVVIGLTGDILRTSSGKVRREAVRQRYLGGHIGARAIERG